MMIVRLLARWSHYYGTYCLHGDHGQCKRECKTCARPCRCRCHRETRRSVRAVA